MNNLRAIREIYGATQEQVAQAINVNRVTVANWENGTSIASSSNREKLSFYYNIDPEYFYDKELDTDARADIVKSSERAKEISEQSEGKQDKESAFHKVFESMTFEHALNFYILSMKMLLATADSGKLEKLKKAVAINSKMGERLNAIIKLREDELESNEPTLYDLIEQIEKEE